MPSFTRHFRPAAPAITRPRPPSPGLRHRRSATVGLIATLVVLAGAIPAQATVIDHEHYSFTDSFQDVICGVEVRHDIVGQRRRPLAGGQGGFGFGVLRDRQLPGGGDADERGQRQLRRRSSTTKSPGRIKATHVSGSIFMFTMIHAGQPILIRDMTGQVVSRDRGVIRETFLWDTLGDDTPGGLFVEQLEPAGERAPSPVAGGLRRGRVLRDRAATAPRLTHEPTSRARRSRMAREVPATPRSPSRDERASGLGAHLAPGTTSTGDAETV